MKRDAFRLASLAGDAHTFSIFPSLDYDNSVQTVSVVDGGLACGWAGRGGQDVIVMHRDAVRVT